MQAGFFWQLCKRLFFFSAVFPAVFFSRKQHSHLHIGVTVITIATRKGIDATSTTLVMAMHMYQ